MLSDNGIIYTFTEKIKEDVFGCMCLLGREYAVKVHHEVEVANREI